MRAATWPRDDRESERLLVVDPQSGGIADGLVRDLPRWLRSGDLLVVNDAATLPASLRAETPGGAAIEVRLVGAPAGGLWSAVLFGGGDWRVRTEDRPPPPCLAVGAVLRFAATIRPAGETPLQAAVVALSELSPWLGHGKY